MRFAAPDNGTDAKEDHPMKKRGSSLRGALILSLMAVLTAAVLASPVSAALTKASVKKIAKRVANKVVTQRSVEFLGNTNVVTQKKTLAQGTGDRITVNCPPGQQATGGGADSPAFFTGGAGPTVAMLMLESKPVVSGTTSTGWEVEVANISSTTPDTNLDITAYAVCSP
jgi:hypothetical protein